MSAISEQQCQRGEQRLVHEHASACATMWLVRLGGREAGEGQGAEQRDSEERSAVAGFGQYGGLRATGWAMRREVLLRVGCECLGSPRRSTESYLL